MRPAVDECVPGLRRQEPVALRLLRGLRRVARSTPWRIAGATAAGAVLFFVLTNFSVWLIGGLYPRAWAGLVNCFVAAVPFFRNTLLSDLLYSALLFGGLALAEKRWPVLAEAAPNPT